MDSSKTIGKFPEVLQVFNFNRLLLMTQLVHLQLAAGSFRT
jgi:hypothetical protein